MAVSANTVCGEVDDFDLAFRDVEDDDFKLVEKTKSINCILVAFVPNNFSSLIDVNKLLLIRFVFRNDY